MSNDIDLKDFIRDIPDFPKPGIIFKDITPILKDPDLFSKTIDIFADRYKDRRVDAVLSGDADIASGIGHRGRDRINEEGSAEAREWDSVLAIIFMANAQ